MQVEKIEDHWNLYAKTKSGEKLMLSHRYGWSEHSCSCQKSKTGLILYPTDARFKNIVLLVCQECYGFQQGNGTQHAQLCKWYFKIYGDSKAFALISGFAQEEEGAFKYNSSTYNEKLMYGDLDYSNGERIMNAMEQKIVQEVVSNKHRSYNIVRAISQGKWFAASLTIRSYIEMIIFIRCTTSH